MCYLWSLHQQENRKGINILQDANKLISEAMKENGRGNNGYINGENKRFGSILHITEPNMY